MAVSIDGLRDVALGKFRFFYLSFCFGHGLDLGLVRLFWVARLFGLFLTVLVWLDSETWLWPAFGQTVLAAAHADVAVGA